MKITQSAYNAVKLLGLDNHKHRVDYPFLFLGRVLPSREISCDKGLSEKSFRVFQAIDSYRAKSNFDVSYVLFRIWSAVKSVFGQSDWQMTVRLMPLSIDLSKMQKTVRNQRMLENVTYSAKEKKLQEILKKNHKTDETIVEVSGPRPCGPQIYLH